MKLGYLLCLTSVLALNVNAIFRAGTPYRAPTNLNHIVDADQAEDYKELYFDNLIDHFTHVGGRDGPTYKMRYLV